MHLSLCLEEKIGMQGLNNLTKFLYLISKGVGFVSKSPSSWLRNAVMRTSPRDITLWFTTGILMGHIPFKEYKLTFSNLAVLLLNLLPVFRMSA